MTTKRFTRAELKVMQAFWDLGKASIREVLETFPKKRRPAYTTIQTLVYRLEEKGAIRRTRKIGGAHIFEPIVSRQMEGRKLLDEVLELFGGRTQPVMSHLIETGRLSREDVEAARRLLDEVDKDDAGGRPRSSPPC